MSIFCKPSCWRSWALVVALGVAGAGPAPVWAASPSEASAGSVLPLAVSVVAPVGLLVSAGVLTVKLVEPVAEGSRWVLERASDGAQLTLVLSGQLAAGVSVAAGTTLEVAAIGAGWVLASAGQAVAFIPNELGRALMHHEKVTR